MAAIRLITLFLVGFLVASILMDTTEAAYKKPPFNGSIFGKRTNFEYDSGKALTAMCEVALEACQSWFPQENK